MNENLCRSVLRASEQVRVRTRTNNSTKRRPLVPVVGNKLNRNTLWPKEKVELPQKKRIAQVSSPVFSARSTVVTPKAALLLQFALQARRMTCACNEYLCECVYVTRCVLDSISA